MAIHLFYQFVSFDRRL